MVRSPRGGGGAVSYFMMSCTGQSVFRVQAFKLCVHVYKCLHGIEPKYMLDLCQPVFAIEICSRLHSAVREQPDERCPKLSTYGRRAFSYTGPSAWNLLPNYLKDSCLTLVMFKQTITEDIFIFKGLSHRVHWRCLHISASYFFLHWYSVIASLMVSW